MTSVKDFAKRLFGTTKIMTAVAVTLVAVGFVVSVVAVGGWISKQQKEAAVYNLPAKKPATGNTGSSTSGSSSSSSSSGSTSSTGSTQYTASQVATHSTANDCWMIIGSSVYDVTNFLDQHPGGAGTMIPYCGKDATQAFATKDRGGSGDGHSESANQLKEEYKVGTLAN